MRTSCGSDGDGDGDGGFDIVVNNANVITCAKVTETNDADWDLALSVNVEAPFRISWAAIPQRAEAVWKLPVCDR